MASFGRQYDGLHLMYLPMALYYAGFLAFVDKGSSDCQQLRLFMEQFAHTVAPCKPETSLRGSLCVFADVDDFVPCMRH